jgi:hypothetical protein
VLFVAEAEEDPVIGGRRDQQDRGRSRGEQCREVRQLLEL